jgi:hypothetical protein
MALRCSGTFRDVLSDSAAFAFFRLAHLRHASTAWRSNMKRPATNHSLLITQDGLPIAHTFAVSQRTISLGLSIP